MLLVGIIVLLCHKDTAESTHFCPFAVCLWHKGASQCRERINHVLPCVEVEATKEHHGDYEDGSDGEGDVSTGGQTGEEIPERHHHLQDQEGDAQEDEEPLGLRVELSHPVEDGEQDDGLKDVQRQLHDLLGDEVDVSPIGPVEMFPD